jgi:hypothetical protein
MPKSGWLRRVSPLVVAFGLAAWSEPAAVTQQGVRPPALPFKMKDKIGKFLQHDVRKFVDKLSLGAAVPFPVLQKDGTWCDLTISPVVGSHLVSAQSTPGAPDGQVVAVIDNPNGCDPNKFDMPKGTRVAWNVNFTGGLLSGPQSNVGVGQLVLLSKHWYQSDEWLTTETGWTLGQCGHQNNPERPDEAAILTRATVCPLTGKYLHNAPAIAGFLRTTVTAARTKRPLTGDDDPSFWFACGADCCYSDLKF